MAILYTSVNLLIINDASYVEPSVAACLCWVFGVVHSFPSMLSAGFVLQIGEFLHRAVEICKAVQLTHGKMLKAFSAALENDPEIMVLKADVEAFATAFEMPGFSVSDL